MSEPTPMLTETSVTNQIGVITLNDPKTLNSLSSDLIKELLGALEDFRNKSVRVVVMNDMSFQEKSLLQCLIFPYILGRERKYAV